MRTLLLKAATPAPAARTTPTTRQTITIVAISTGAVVATGLTAVVAGSIHLLSHGVPTAALNI